MEDFFKEKWLNNTVEDYLIATAIAVGGILIIRIFRNIALGRLKKWSEKTETSIDDLVVKGIERFALPILSYLVLYNAINYLALNEAAQKWVKIVTAVVITFFVLRMITTTVQLLLQSYVRRLENGEEKVKQLKGITVIINIVIWILGAVFLFDNLGYNVAAIITGLGIGGIAIALAAQNILGDLFNYFVIFFDRPFEIGDFVVIDDKRGHVEHVGIKTTRIKSLTGEQLVVSNSDLTKSRLHNFKRMQRRRIQFTIGVTYQTKKQQLEEIPQIIKSAIEENTNTTFDRSHFATYGDFSLNFETVYFVESSEFNDYMDIQQKINLKIFEEFENRGIEFAYPTQTVFLTKTEA